MKKVLIITYYWPPAGGPGVQRWLKFVKYLPDFNLQPVVYIPQNPTYPIIDTQLQSQIPSQAIIVKNKITEPYKIASFLSKKDTNSISSGIIPNAKKQSILQKILLWIRGNVFIPDARILWVKPSVKYLTQYLQDHQIDTIITTGPPHSLHLIGLKLRQTLPIRWIADFRDPWTTIGYQNALKLTPYAAKKHKKQEKQVLDTADTIIVTSQTTKKEFQNLTNTSIQVITNGYDTETNTKQPLDTQFTMAHIGSFLSNRNPLILWQSLQELLTELPEFAAHFKLKLIGKISQEILTTINQYNLTPYCQLLGYLPHSQAIAHQKKSQVLLLIEINSDQTKSIIPGKLFEYMVSNRPIIGIGPEKSDFAQILTATNTGTFFTYTQKQALKTTIKNHFKQYQKQQLTVHPVGLDQYSRKNLTQQLAQLLQ